MRNPFTNMPDPFELDPSRSSANENQLIMWQLAQTAHDERNPQFLAHRDQERSMILLDYHEFS